MTEQILENPAVESDADELTAFDPSDVVEVPMLISVRQMLALEEAAHNRGMTTGEMVRHLVQEFVIRATARKVKPT